MARRALMPGDVVAACPRRRGRQAHFADRFDVETAFFPVGELIPHEQYTVVSPVFVGRDAHKLLIVALPDGSHTRVGPGTVRLWDNPLERRHRRETRRAAEGG